MMFLADAMLQKLARWLRMLGYSAESPHVEDDDALIRHALAHNLILLTCDEQLFQKAKNYCKCCLVESGDLEDQLLQVCREFKIGLSKIDESAVPSEKICSSSNGYLRQVQKARIKPLVPPKSYKSAELFWQCVSCRKIFWTGSHNTKIIYFLRRLKRRERVKKNNGHV